MSSRPRWFTAPRLNRVKSLVERYAVPVWLAILPFLAGYFVWCQRDQITRIGEVLRAADPSWVVVAIAFEIFVLAMIGLIYYVLLRRLGHRISCPSLLALHLQRMVIGTFSPIGGPPSVYVFVRCLGQRGVRAEDALFTLALRGLSGNAAFLILLLPAFLLVRPSTTMLTSAIALAGLFLLLLGGLAALLRGGATATRWTHRLPTKVVGLVQRVRAHRVAPRDLLRPVGLALLVRLGGAGMLYAGLRAVGEQPSLAVPLTAYMIGMLVLMVAPIFGGIGVVEMSIALALQRLGISPGAALGAALICRLAEFWLPLALGLLLPAWSPIAARFAPAPRPTRTRGQAPAILRPVPARALQPVRLTTPAHRVTNRHDPFSNGD